MKALSVYHDETFAVATMHEKQRAIARPFDRWLGAAVVVAPSIDTDAFGTFTGEIARQGTMQDAARVKAMAAIEATGLAFGLGSEGSFGPHPAVPFVAAGMELLLCVDQKRGLEVYETLPATRTNFRSLACRPCQDISKFLSQVEFPSHAVAVSPNAPSEPGRIFKGLTCGNRLAYAVTEAAAASCDRHALVVTDMRAHLNPTRMASIRALATRLARRLSTLCPACEAPGFGAVDLVRGLPCQWCGEPTRLVIAELLRCSQCGIENYRAVNPRRTTADPGQCQSCNP